jgi:hypothetical protein
LLADDDLFLDKPTATKISFSFNIVVILLLSIYVCVLWKKSSMCTYCKCDG